MNKGLLISGLGHLGLVLWALLGGWFTWTTETPAVQVAQVSLMTTSEFDAMTSAAPTVDDTAPAPELQPPTTKTPKPKPRPADPTPDAVAPDAPVVPPPVAAPSDTPQPIPVQPSDKAPAPSTAERIASTPVDAPDQPKTADVATEAQTETPSPDSVAVPEQQAAAPEKTVTAVIPDAKPTEDDAPQLAPTTSPRPQARPKPVEISPEDTKAAKTQPTDQKPPDTPATDQAAIDAALAGLASETAAETPAPSQTGSSGTGDQPIGAKMNSGELDGLRRAIQDKWNIGSLSTTAAQVIVVVAGTLSQDGKVQSIGMVSFTGGTDEAAQLAYTAAKSAIYRATNEGLNLPAEKYDDWKDFEFTFDPTNGRLR